MDGYIKKQALLDYARNQIGGQIDMNDIARFPCADVVPKSEVEKLEQTVKYLEGVCESLPDKVRVAVAMEIFEKIEKSVTSKIPPHIRLIFKDDRGFEDGFRDGKTDALIEVLVLIAELRKKYTERGGAE